jgi:hypothetical protein
MLIWFYFAMLQLLRVIARGTTDWPLRPLVDTADAPTRRSRCVWGRSGRSIQLTQSPARIGACRVRGRLRSYRLIRLGSSPVRFRGRIAAASRLPSDRRPFNPVSCSAFTTECNLDVHDPQEGLRATQAASERAGILGQAAKCASAPKRAPVELAAYDSTCRGRWR